MQQLDLTTSGRKVNKGGKLYGPRIGLLKKLKRIIEVDYFDKQINPSTWKTLRSFIQCLGPNGCYPRIEYIAVQGSMDVRTVHRHLNILEQYGLIKRKSGQRTHHSNSYSFPFGKWDISNPIAFIDVDGSVVGRKTMETQEDPEVLEYYRANQDQRIEIIRALREKLTSNAQREAYFESLRPSTTFDGEEDPDIRQIPLPGGNAIFLTYEELFMKSLDEFSISLTEEEEYETKVKEPESSNSKWCSCCDGILRSGRCINNQCENFDELVTGNSDGYDIVCDSAFGSNREFRW